MADKRKYRWRRLLVLAGLLALVWLVGLFVFVDRIHITIAIHEEGLHATAPVDAIIVLTGGRGRVERGTELLTQTAATRMLISGVGSNVMPRDLIPATTLDTDTLDCCVTLGRAARNTRENAVEAAGWVAANGVTSLRLVTADFHMPRSLLEFHSRLPDTKIVPDPVKSENVRLSHWWLWPGTAFLLAGEYNKYIAAGTRLALTRILDEG